KARSARLLASSSTWRIFLPARPVAEKRTVWSSFCSDRQARMKWPITCTKRSADTRADELREHPAGLLRADAPRHAVPSRRQGVAPRAGARLGRESELGVAVAPGRERPRRNDCCRRPEFHRSGERRSGL